MNNPLPVGLEVSKDNLLLALPEPLSTKILSFPNTRSGHRELLRRLRNLRRPVRVACEATGNYGLDVALALAATPNIEITVLNPRRVKEFARSRGQRQKSDPLDAVLLRDFVAVMPFRPWHPPTPAALELRQFTRRIATLTDLRTAELSRLHAARASRTSSPALLRSMNTLIRQYTRDIDALERDARKIVRAHPELERSFQLLRSIKGFGDRSALLLLGELGVLSDDFTAREWVSLAGLFPRVERSGSSVHRRRGIGHAGNKYLRRALFMPAMAAVRSCPPLRDFHARLVARGFTRLQGITAVMRRLLHIAHAVLHHQTPFDVHRVGTRKTAMTA